MNKKLLALILTIILYIPSNTYCQWKTIDVLDDFNDKIGETEAFIGNGTFSNSATSNSELKVKVVIKEEKNEDGEKYKSLDNYRVWKEKISKNWEPSLRKFALKKKNLVK